MKQTLDFFLESLPVEKVLSSHISSDDGATVPYLAKRFRSLFSSSSHSPLVYLSLYGVDVNRLAQGDSLSECIDAASRSVRSPRFESVARACEFYGGLFPDFARLRYGLRHFEDALETAYLGLSSEIPACETLSSQPDKVLRGFQELSSQFPWRKDPVLQRYAAFVSSVPSTVQ